MATITSSLMTFEEFELLPGHVGKQELLRGELIELPPARRRHNMTGERFYDALKEFVNKLRRERSDMVLGGVHHEMGYYVAHNPDSWLIPDVSLTHPNQPGEEYYEGAPLLAVEVVSPSNSAEQIAIKVSVYLANGSREVWVAYQKTRSVWVYRATGGTLVQGTLRTELLPGLSIDLETLFAG